MSRTKRPEADRFWTKVSKSSGCWLWTGSVNVDGYAKFGRNGKWVSAHRVSYELKYGEIPDGMCVCHRCDVRNCVNPDHLFLGTHRDNMEDMARDGSKKGERHHGARLTENQVVEMRLMYAMGQCSQKSLALHFGVSPTTVYRVVRRTGWSHVA